MPDGRRHPQSNTRAIFDDKTYVVLKIAPNLHIERCSITALRMPHPSNNFRLLGTLYHDRARIIRLAEIHSYKTLCHTQGLSNLRLFVKRNEVG